MEELENPFLENNETLVCLDTKDMAENIVCDTEKLDSRWENKNLRNSSLKGYLENKKYG